MNWNTKGILAVTAALGLGLAVGLMFNYGPAALAQPGKSPAGGARYSVLETDATHLLVTDNQTNTFYFYTIDKDQPVGSELKLRGTIDLNQVGKPSLQPKKTKDKE